MWLLASTIVLCFTIVTMFFLFGKLLESKWRHERLVQSDINQHVKYTAITQRPAPKPAMPDFRPARHLKRSTGNHSHPESYYMDPQMTELMQAGISMYEEGELPRVPTLHELRKAEEMIRRPTRRTL